MSAKPSSRTRQRSPLGLRSKEPAFGFALSSEENSPLALVRQAQKAEEIGLDFVSISDHFHPWLPAQGNSPFVWAGIGGIAITTERIVVGRGVTCPILRMHPVIVAQAAATAAAMLEGRFYLGLGTGEALNELVTGERWPSARERLERLKEAVEVMTELFSGDSVSHDGEYYTVANARLYTRPAVPPPILIASASTGSAELAATLGGLIATGPDDTVFEAFESAGGKNKPRLGQVTICWDESEKKAREIARRYWATTVLNWATRSSVAIPEVFEDITKSATKEDIARNILCGPDLAPVVTKVRDYLKAGFDHVYVHQVGTKQEEFLDVYAEELLPQLRDLRVSG